MGKLFGGGSKSKQTSTNQSTSTSNNQAYNPLLEAYQPLLGYANEGAAKYKSFLGGDRTGFDDYLKNTSFNFDRQRGEGAIGTALSSKGLRNSGAMLKKLTGFNNDLQNQYGNQYMDRLLGMMGIGTGAGQLLAGAGGQSNSQSTGSSTGSSSSKGGIGSTIGSVASAIAASDPRLKHSISRVGEYEDGLGIYDFEYTYKPGKFRGVMADEVKVLRPWALGPEVGGYMTVRYDKLERDD